IDEDDEAKPKKQAPEMTRGEFFATGTTTRAKEESRDWRRTRKQHHEQGPSLSHRRLIAGDQDAEAHAKSRNGQRRHTTKPTCSTNAPVWKHHPAPTELWTSRTPYDETPSTGRDHAPPHHSAGTTKD
ncbi:unnamed protein product, partial [Brassica rapa]